MELQIEIQLRRPLGLKKFLVLGLYQHLFRGFFPQGVAIQKFYELRKNNKKGNRK